MRISDWSSDVCSSDLRLAVDGKLSRPGVCNALETLLVRADIADKWLPDALATLARGGAGIRGCERTRALFADARPVTEEDYDRSEERRVGQGVVSPGRSRWSTNHSKKN